MFNIFLGGALHKLPGRNFSRFLLATFVLYSMVLRSAYQGAMFNFMRMEEQPQEVKKIFELARNKFDFYALDSLKEYLDQVQNSSKWVTPLSVTDFEKFRFRLNRERNLALMTSEDHIAYWNKIGFPRDFFYFLPEKVSTVNLGIYFPKSSCLINVINKKIFELTDNGLMDIFRYQTIEKSYLKKRNYQREPKQLGIRHIRGGLYLLEIGMLVSLVVFVVEVIWGRKGRKAI